MFKTGFSRVMHSLALMLLVFICSCAPKAQNEDALDAARRLAAEGKYAEALEKHVWFHDHILETNPSYYGVRLSFALADWVQLGKKYPPALVTLKDIRDKKTARLLAGEPNRDLFHDVESINDYLGESAATVALFEKLDTAQPAFATKVYDLADEALIAAQEYDLAKKYLGDPMKRFNQAQRGFEEGMKFAKTSSSRDASRKAFESIFSDEIIRLITVLDKTGDSVKAKEIQTKALVILESPAIRKAIK